MLIRFRLAWLKPGTSALKGFKFPAAGSLFKEYTDRISKFTPSESLGLNFKRDRKISGIHRWLCDRNGKAVSSETIAKNFQALIAQGVRQLEIIVGGPNGFSVSEIEILKADFRWVLDF